MCTSWDVPIKATYDTISGWKEFTWTFRTFSIVPDTCRELTMASCCPTITLTTPPCPEGFDTRGSSTWTRTKEHLVSCSTPGSRVCDSCAISRHHLYTEILGATTFSFRWYLVVLACQDWQTHVRLVADGNFDQVLSRQYSKCMYCS